ncbi:DNA helicase [Tanacetum coccineum]
MITDERLRQTAAQNAPDDDSQITTKQLPSLIELLDNHNALVQLFRTAREKLPESEVPLFKIRLYSFVGAREYELPTRDMLGEVVYEPDPDTEMDYYIIIEQRIGQSQRVNKLHPSYMALQFPLMFVYGKDGYSKEMKMVRVPDAITCEDSDGSNYSGRLILPQSFTSGPRYIQSRHSGPGVRDKDSSIYEVLMGTGQIVARVTRNNVRPSSFARKPEIIIDKIKNYLDARYIGRHEACWRLFEFDIHSREPVVQVLVVHGQNMQRIVFRNRDQLQSVADNPQKKKTTLTEWLDYNEHHTDIRQLTMSYVHSAVGDLFYQRMLLSHQKGCRSFWEIRTVNSVAYPTCRVVCKAMDLLGDDRQWEITLEEEASTATPTELQTLFVHILTHCQVSNPLVFWKRTWNLMKDDIPYVTSISLGIPNLHIPSSDLENYTLYELEGCLNHCSRSLTDFGIPLPPKDLVSLLQNRLLMKEKSYNCDLLSIERDKLNSHQRNIFDLIINVVATNAQELIFVYGHGELNGSSVCSITKNTQLAKLLKETNLIIWDKSLMNDRRCFETLDRTLMDVLDTPNKLFVGKTIMLGGDFRQTLPVKKGVPHSEIIGSSMTESYLWPSFKLFVLTENMRITQ